MNEEQTDQFDKILEAVTPFWEKNDPDFINDKGIKWWLDKDLTKYARNKPNCEQMIAYVVKEPSGELNRLLVENEEIIYGTQVLEDLCVHIDIESFARETKKDD